MMITSAPEIPSSRQQCPRYTKNPGMRFLNPNMRSPKPQRRTLLNLPCLSNGISNPCLSMLGILGLGSSVAGGRVPRARSWYSPSEDLHHFLKYRYIFWVPKGYVVCKPQTLNRVDPTEGARCSLTRLRRRFALRQPRRRSCARQFPSNVFCFLFFYIYTYRNT